MLIFQVRLSYTTNLAEMYPQTVRTLFKTREQVSKQTPIFLTDRLILIFQSSDDMKARAISEFVFAERLAFGHLSLSGM